MPRQKRRKRQQHSEINYHENQTVTDVTVPWLYESHSLLLLGGTLATILYFAFAYETVNTEDNIWHGIYLVLFTFLSIGCLTFPAGPYIRPHPILWRGLFGLSILYMLSLVLLVCQTSDQARKALKLLDPSLGKPIETRDYATDCELNWNIFISVMDRFVLAHFLGWMAKAIVIRNRALLWFLSISWELIELATKYFIPNFAECWWDSILLDVLICNGGGIEFSLWICKRLEIRDNMWSGIYNIDGMIGKLKRFALQFTPFEFDPIKWEPLSSWKQWFFVHILIIATCLADLNAFLLKLFLWIPTEHWINFWRMIFLGIICIPSAKQYYLYINDPLCKKMGSQCWVLVIILILEQALIFKVAPQLPPVPTLNQWLWAGAGLVYLFFSFIMLRSYSHVKVD